jgi:toxin ParE1/3/4
VRSLEFHPEAQAELIAAAQYFEREAENLGADFLDFVQRTAVRLVQFPESGRRVGRRLRRVVVPRFSCFCIA